MHLPKLFQPQLPSLLKAAAAEKNQPEKPNFGWLGSTAALVGGQLPVSAGMTGYLASTSHLRPHAANPYPRRPGDSLQPLTTGGQQATQQQIEALAQRMGLSTKSLGINYRHDLPAFYSEASLDPFGLAKKQHGVNMVVNLPTAATSLSGSGAPRVSRGVAAHELGHAVVGDRLRSVGGNTLARGNQLLMAGGKVLGGVSPLGVALSGDDNTAWRWAQAGTLGSAPVLLNELAASHIGGRHLAGYHGGGLKPRVGNYFSTYRGIPTYLLAGSLPMATFGARKAYKYVTGTKDRGDLASTKRAV